MTLSYNRYVMRMLPLFFLAAFCAAGGSYAEEPYPEAKEPDSPSLEHAAPAPPIDKPAPKNRSAPAVAHPAPPDAKSRAKPDSSRDTLRAASKTTAKPDPKKTAAPASAHPISADSQSSHGAAKAVKPAEKAAHSATASSGNAADAHSALKGSAPGFAHAKDPHAAAKAINDKTINDSGATASKQRAKAGAHATTRASETNAEKPGDIHSPRPAEGHVVKSDAHAMAKPQAHGDEKIPANPKASAPDPHGQKAAPVHAAEHGAVSAAHADKQSAAVESHRPGPGETHTAPSAAHEETPHETGVGHEEEQEDHEPSAQPSHGSRDSEIPQMAGRPDTAFARAADWEKGTAEVLSYAVTRKGKTGPIQCRGNAVTERMYLMPDGTADRKPVGKAWVEILNTVLSASGEDGGLPFALETVVKLPRKERMRLLRQDQSWQSWPGATHRTLDCRVSPPRLRVLSSGGEAGLDTTIARWPVFTEEMLFTYLRSVPQRDGYREEVWFQDWGAEGRFAIQPQFAVISVRSKAPAIRDMETWYITVDREDGRRSEFWVSSTGLHPVVLAVLMDRSTWTLQEITRRKYWAW